MPDRTGVEFVYGLSSNAKILRAYGLPVELGALQERLCKIGAKVKKSDLEISVSGLAKGLALGPAVKVAMHAEDSGIILTGQYPFETSLDWADCYQEPVSAFLRAAGVPQLVMGRGDPKLSRYDVRAINEILRPFGHHIGQEISGFQSFPLHGYSVLKGASHHKASSPQSAAQSQQKYKANLY